MASRAQNKQKAWRASVWRKNRELLILYGLNWLKLGRGPEAQTFVKDEQLGGDAVKKPGNKPHASVKQLTRLVTVDSKKYQTKSEAHSF